MPASLRLLSSRKATAEPLCGGSAVLDPSWRQPFSVAEETRTLSFAAPGFARVCLCSSEMFIDKGNGIFGYQVRQ